MAKVKHSLDDELVAKLDNVAALLEINRSVLISKILTSAFTEQMHFNHVVKELWKNNE